jgi:exodeoxyribonuclease VII large subunit
LLHRQAQRLDELTARAQAAIATAIRRRFDLTAYLAAAVLRHDPRQAIAQARERLQASRNHLHRSVEHRLHAHANSLNSLNARLRSLSPLAVLDRGYAIVVNADGQVVRSAGQIKAGDLVNTRVAKGAFASRVESSPEAEKPPRAKRAK